jgi:hypothetical protein
MVRFRLDHDCDVSALGEGLREIIFNLIGRDETDG